MKVGSNNKSQIAMCAGIPSERIYGDSELISCVNFNKKQMDIEFDFSNKSLKMIEPFLYDNEKNEVF